MAMPKEREFDVTQFKQDQQAYKTWFAMQFSADEEDATAQNLAKLIHKAIQYELTDIQRDYFIAYYLNGLTMEEIGEIHGVDKSTVSRTVTRAKNRIERILKYSSPKLMRIWERGDKVVIARQNRKESVRFKRGDRL